MTKLTALPLWELLEKHKNDINSVESKKLFKENVQSNNFVFEVDELYIDLSRNILTAYTVELLIKLAKSRGLKNHIDNLYKGKKVNFTENKPALHMALRVKNQDDDLIACQDIIASILACKKRLYEFSNKIREGIIRGSTGKKFTDIVCMGVGGSILGPKLLYHAFLSYPSKFKLHFVSGVDGFEISFLLKQLDPETTLFIIASKSFKTDDTIVNAKIAKNWLIKNVKQYALHLVGVSANEEAVFNFGILEDYFFKLPEFIGGRYSIWSAISLGPIIAFGNDFFDEFLSGGYIIDKHFKQSILFRNIPILLALIDIWYIDFLKFQTRVVLPYSGLLDEIPSYLQQLEMESCGKQISFENELINYQTGPIIWGDIGFLGQHSFYQFLHQSNQIIPADFIVPVFSQSLLEECEHLHLCHALAQIQALAEGNKTKNLYENLLGNHPVSVILFPRLTPKVLGMLIALYEHKVFAKCAIWGINPFDQFGVEYGKNLVNYYINQLKINMINTNDTSTMSNLIDYILRYIK